MENLTQFWDRPNWNCCNNPRMDFRYDYKDGFGSRQLCCGNGGKVIHDYGSVDYRTWDERRGAW